MALVPLQLLAVLPHAQLVFTMLQVQVHRLQQAGGEDVGDVKDAAAAGGATACGMLCRLMPVSVWRSLLW
jgi:hypothetical protein